MRKALTAVAVLIIVIFAAVYWNKAATSTKYIDKVNEKMDMGEFKLLMEPVSPQNMEAKGFLNTGGFGCLPYENKQLGLFVNFVGFPDVLDKYVLTQIETTNPNYHFYDINVGDDAKKAEDILKRNGFSQLDSKSITFIEFKKKSLIVSLMIDKNAKITEIKLHLPSTNKKGVVF